MGDFRLVKTKDGDELELGRSNTIVSSKKDRDLLGGILRSDGTVDLIGGGKKKVQINEV